jgi:hypothetical protein
VFYIVITKHILLGGNEVHIDRRLLYYDVTYTSTI